VESYGRMDTYHSSFDDTKTRISKSFPVLENKASCSYPIYSKISEDYSSIWSPKISISSIRACNKRRNLELNEDSVFGDFNDLNRYSGLDKIENDERISCGLEDSIYHGSNRLLNLFVGRSKSENFGRIVLKPADFLMLRARFVGIPFLDKSKAFELGSTYKINRLSFDVSYFGDKRKNKHREFSLSQIGYSTAYQVTEYWSISYSQIFNLQKKAGHKNLSRGIYAKYKDECFEFIFGVYKSKYKEQDLKPKSGIIIAFAFRNLGDLSQSSRKSEYQPIIGRVG
jgi:lipopolysaccharide assembly outer membrane protein LptD (OstA)